jgi:hypothetical protein
VEGSAGAGGRAEGSVREIEARGCGQRWTWLWTTLSQL